MMGQAENRVLFVVGNSRSGTTMLGRVLNGNSHIHTFGELHFFEHQVDAKTLRERTKWDIERLIRLLERLLTSSREGFFARAQEGRYSPEAKDILDRVVHRDPLSVYREFLFYETNRKGKSIPCEQTPRYLFFLDEILAAFPDARVINMVRDPRDVLISQKNKWKRRFLGAKAIPVREAIRAWANYHPYLIAKLWSSCIHQAARFHSDTRVMTLRFEDLLENPEHTVRALVDFVGVPFETEMLQVPHVGSSAGMDKPEQLGINPTRASGWKQGGLSRHDLAICEWVACREMLEQGYELVGDGNFKLITLPSMLQLIFKLSIAVPMNLTRTRNIMDTIKRRLFAKGGT